MWPRYPHFPCIYTNSSFPLYLRLYTLRLGRPIWNLEIVSGLLSAVNDVDPAFLSRLILTTSTLRTCIPPPRSSLELSLTFLYLSLYHEHHLYTNSATASPGVRGSHTLFLALGAVWTETTTTSGCGASTTPETSRHCIYRVARPLQGFNIRCNRGECGERCSVV